LVYMFLHREWRRRRLEKFLELLYLLNRKNIALVTEYVIKGMKHKKYLMMHRQGKLEWMMLDREFHVFSYVPSK